MMTYQASRDDGPRLKEGGETSVAAGTSALEVTHLRRSYGSVVAVDDVSFSVAEGEIFGGPNGAGETTTVECVISAPRTGRQDDPVARPGPPGRPGRGPRDRRRAAPGQRVPGQAQRGREPRHVSLFYLSPELFKDVHTGAASHEQ
jgi:hypothetical protein